MASSLSLLGWNNLAKAATISATSATASLPASNVQDDGGSPSSGWQTLAGVTTATLTISPVSAAQVWDVISLHRTNLTVAATVTFTLYNGIAPAGSTIWTTTLGGPENGSGQVIAIPPAGTVADWCSILIVDSPPEGFLNIPLLYCGSVWAPLGSASYASTMGRDVTTSEATSRGGSEFPAFHYSRKRWDISFDSLRTSEVWSSLDPLLNYAQAGGNVLFIPDSSSSYINQECVYGRLKTTSSISYPAMAAERRKITVTVTERL